MIQFIGELTIQYETYGIGKYTVQYLHISMHVPSLVVNGNCCQACKNGGEDRGDGIFWTFYGELLAPKEMREVAERDWG